MLKVSPSKRETDMRFYIYWKHQAPGTPPVATIDADTAEAAFNQFDRECRYPLRADQMSVETELR